MSSPDIHVTTHNPIHAHAPATHDSKPPTPQTGLGCGCTPPPVGFRPWDHSPSLAPAQGGRKSMYGHARAHLGKQGHAWASKGMKGQARAGKARKGKHGRAWACKTTHKLPYAPRQARTPCVHAPMQHAPPQASALYVAWGGPQCQLG